MKKAQNGTKATKDSTNIYAKRVVDSSRALLKPTAIGKTDSLLNVASKNVKDLGRQFNKGKSGYDANGFPVKKHGGKIKK